MPWSEIVECDLAAQSKRRGGSGNKIKISSKQVIWVKEFIERKQMEARHGR